MHHGGVLRGTIRATGSGCLRSQTRIGPSMEAHRNVLSRTILDEDPSDESGMVFEAIDDSTSSAWGRPLVSGSVLVPLGRASFSFEGGCCVSWGAGTLAGSGAS